MAPKKPRQEKEFVSRWGNIILDDRGYVDIPGWILRNYHKCGVSPLEMMFVAHVMSFKYDCKSGRSENAARPSLNTIAMYMGRDIKNVRRLKSGMIDRGLLVVTSDAGKPDEYDFSGLTNRCLQYATEEEAEQVQNRTSKEKYTPPKNVRGTKPPLPKTPLPILGGEESEVLEESEINTPNPDGLGGASAAPDVPVADNLKATEPSNPVGQNGSHSELPNTSVSKQEFETLTPGSVPPPSPSLDIPHGFDPAYSSDGKVHLFKSKTKHPTTCVKCHAPLGTWSQVASGRTFEPCCDWHPPKAPDAVIYGLCALIHGTPQQAKVNGTWGHMQAICNDLYPAVGAITAGQIELFRERWYSTTWQGQKRQRPTVKDVKDNWIALVTAPQPAPATPAPNGKPPFRPTIIRS